MDTETLKALGAIEVDGVWYSLALVKEIIRYAIKG